MTIRNKNWPYPKSSPVCDHFLSYLCTMRHSKTEPVSDVLGSYLQSLGIDKKLKEVRLVNSWEEIVGKLIARSTTRIEIQKGVLHVGIRSSVMKNELSLLKEGLIKSLNDKVGEEVIYDIKFW